MSNHTFIIAEAGVNHNGRLDLAKKLIESAAGAGANAVKFQAFTAEKIVSHNADKASYQKASTGANESQFEMLKRLELNEAQVKELAAHCLLFDIMFLSTPFDLDSVDMLKSMGMKIFKIPSGEITNLPLLRKIGSLKKQIILSTGMADMQEIKDAVNILTNTGTNRENITLLHCNTEYPTPYADVNLRAMLTLQETLSCAVGYSDHTLGIEVPIAAVTLGASVIEKHFTLDKNLAGPDHRTSLDPLELRAMTTAIRNIERAMGERTKQPSPSELPNRDKIRKSILAACIIEKGEFFSENNLCVKRPGTGLSPMQWDNVIGLRATRDFQKDEEIEL